MAHDTFQLELSGKEEAIRKAKDLKLENPDKCYWVIASRGKYYVEDNVPFIRSWESLVYATD